MKARAIRLTRGYMAMVDAEDYARVAQYRWHAHEQHRRDGSIRNVYAEHVEIVDGVRTIFRLHRFVLGITDPKVRIDHHDHNGLNCTRNNLRVATKSQNGQNQRRSTRNKTGAKGVSFVKARGKYRVYIKHDGMNQHLGYFRTKTVAQQVYDNAALKFFGSFAAPNAMLSGKTHFSGDECTTHI